MSTITEVITPLPAAPDPATMTPSQFSAAAAAYVLAQKNMVPEQNTMAGQMNAVASEINANLLNQVAPTPVYYTGVKTAAYIVGGGNYAVPCDTSAAGFTVTLPAGAVSGEVTIIDYAKTFRINSLTVAPNGTDNIAGANANFILDLNGTFKFHWFDATMGWVII